MRSASVSCDPFVLAVKTEEIEVIEETMPRNKQRLVQAWIEIHREDLMTDWRLAVSGQNPVPIKPLE